MMFLENSPLKKFKQRFAEIQKRHKEWVAPINQATKEKMMRVNRDGYTFQDFQREIAEIRQQQLAKYNPFEESSPVIEELCSLYLQADVQQRAEIRDMVKASEFWVWDAPMHYMRSKIDSLQVNPDENTLRMALAAASIQDCSVDYRDVLLILADMFVVAERAGIDPIPLFAEMAELSSDQLPTGGTTAMKDILSNFQTYAVVTERRAKS